MNVIPLAEITDFALLEIGILTLDCLEEDGPVVNPLGCFMVNEDYQFETRHDWSIPFLFVDEEFGSEDIQTCHACGEVRRPTYGPYLGMPSTAATLPAPADLFLGP